MNSNHIVYAGYYENTLVYIGRGAPLRYKHLNSGTSHVYEANKVHFQGGVIDIRILHDNLALQESIDIECMEIKSKLPKWNIKYIEVNQGLQTSSKVYNCLRKMLNSQRHHVLQEHKLEYVNIFMEILRRQNSMCDISLADISRIDKIGGRLFDVIRQKRINSIPKHFHEIVYIHRNDKAKGNEPVRFARIDIEKLFLYYPPHDDVEIKE